MDGWVADTVFGDFDGGFLKVPQVGGQFRLQQGDIILYEVCTAAARRQPYDKGKEIWSGLVYAPDDAQRVASYF